MARANKITRKTAVRVLEIVDAGLSTGLGNPVPGKMCIEAAVNYALGLPHDDKPDCVAPVLRSLTIALNDKTWSSPAARAKGLRRLAIAQLGSAGALAETKFLEQVIDVTIRKIVPRAMRSAKVQRTKKHSDALENAAALCETRAAARAAAAAARAAAAEANPAGAAVRAANAAGAAAEAAANAAGAAAKATANAAAKARDEALAFFCEEVVQILIAMKAPGTQWLDLTEAAE